MIKEKNPVLNFTDINTSLLKSLPEPNKCGYEQVIDIPEFTFLGEHEQPDFGHITLWFYSGKKIIELKSLRQYIVSWRNVRVSYERAINIMYDHLIEVYNPHRLRIEISFRPRGGITSLLRIDSDWGCRGGTDQIWRDHNS